MDVERIARLHKLGFHAVMLDLGPPLSPLPP